MLRRDLAIKAATKKGKYAFLYALFASSAVTLFAMGNYLEDKELTAKGLQTNSEKYAENARNFGNKFRSKPYDPEIFEQETDSKTQVSFGVRDMFKIRITSKEEN